MRKNIIIAAAVISFSLPVMAEPSASPLKLCTAVSSLAKTIMVKRQEGVGMVTMLEIAGDNSMAQTLVMEAFDHPLYHTDRVKQRTINEFANYQMRGCMEALRK